MIKIRRTKVFYKAVREAHHVANTAVSTEVRELRAGCFQCQTGDQVVRLRRECEALVREESESFREFRCVMSTLRTFLRVLVYY
jgi:hypothetical protein